MTNPRIGAAYIRVSTDDQLEYSPESQIKAIRDYAKSHNIILPNEYIFQDDGISGRKADKRPGFQKMISTAKETPAPFQVILVWKFSRFARNREDSIVYKSMLRKQCGIDVISIAEPLGDDKTSILMEAILEAMDEYYSINLGEEVKRGMTQKASKGEPLSVPPYGYCLKDKELYIKEDEAKIVRFIFEKYVGGESVREITRQCNDMNARTHRGNIFETRTVDYILNNPVYIGKIRWNPERRTRRNFDDPDIMIVDGHHERIIDDKLWNEAKVILEKKKKAHKKSEKPFGFRNIFQGIIRCSACGSTLIKSGESLQCYKYTKAMCSESHHLSYKKAEKIIFEQIKTDFELGQFNNLQRIEKKTSETELIAEQIAREEKKLERAKEAYLSGIDTAQEYQDNKTAITNTINKLKEKMSKNEEKPMEDIRKEFIKNNKKIYEKLFNSKTTLEEKNKTLKSFVDKIVYNKNTKELSIYYYV